MRRSGTWPETQKAVRNPNVARAIADLWRQGRPVLFTGPGSFYNAVHELNVKLMSRPADV